MESVREIFHEIGNWHNKICVAAGLTKVVLQEKYKKGAKHQPKEDIIKRLTKIEGLAKGADKALLRLKDVIYEIIDPDTGKPRKGG